MKVIHVLRMPLLATMPLESLAAHYKALGLDPRLAFDQLIIDKLMNPGIDAKEFHSMHEQAAPALIQPQIIEVEYEPNVTDAMLGKQAMLLQEASGVWRIVWEHGVTGSFPPDFPPSPERFIPLNAAAA